MRRKKISSQRDEEAEVVADCREGSVVGVAVGVGEIVAVRAMPVFEMTDDGLERRRISRLISGLRCAFAWTCRQMAFKTVIPV